MIVRLTIASSMLVRARRGLISAPTTSAAWVALLCNGDCYVMPYAVIHNGTVVQAIADFFPMAARRLFTPTLLGLSHVTHRDWRGFSLIAEVCWLHRPLVDRFVIFSTWTKNDFLKAIAAIINILGNKACYEVQSRVIMAKCEVVKPPHLICITSKWLYWNHLFYSPQTLLLWNYKCLSHCCLVYVLSTIQTTQMKQNWFMNSVEPQTDPVYIRKICNLKEIIRS